MTKSFKTMQPCTADRNKIKFPVIIQPKIDGVKILIKDGKALGRSLKPIANKYLLDFFSDSQLNGLEGEIIVGNDPLLDRVCSLTTSMVNTIEGEPTDFTFFVFDDFYSTDQSYVQRHRDLVKFVSLLNGTKYENKIRVINGGMIHNLDQMDAAHQHIMKIGYEGSIIRDPESLYKNGRVSVNQGQCMRLKDYTDDEAVCTGLIEAEENTNEAKINELGLSERSTHKANMKPKGMVGTILAKFKGQDIKIGPGNMTHEERIHFWNNQNEIIGKLVKFKHFEHGVKDLPRHPTFICIRSEDDL